MARFVPPPLEIPERSVLRAPASKSATHRAVTLAGLAGGRSHIRFPLVAEDTEATRLGLAALGVEVETGDDAWSVQGVGGHVEGGASIDAHASGTTLRLLTAVAALGVTSSRLGGTARLAVRPIDPLLEALRLLGAHAVRLSPAMEGAFLEAGGRAFRGGTVAVDASASSQFASALLTIAACLPQGIDLTLRGPAVSLPYLALTTEMMARFGAAVQVDGGRYRVGPTPLRGADIEIEGDWSSGAYLLAAAAIAGGTVTVEGLRPDSRQADAAVMPLLQRSGAQASQSTDAVTVTGTGSIRAFEVDLRHAPDLAPTAAVLALFAEGRSVLRGVAQLPGKESDRLQAIADALAVLGRTARIGPDVLVIEPADRPLQGGRVPTRSDHRIAMAFALSALRIPGAEVDDTACVAKSYTGFWSDLERVRTGTRGRPTSRRDRHPWS